MSTIESAHGTVTAKFVHVLPPDNAIPMQLSVVLPDIPVVAVQLAAILQHFSSVSFSPRFPQVPSVLTALLIILPQVTLIAWTSC